MDKSGTGKLSISINEGFRDTRNPLTHDVLQILCSNVDTRRLVYQLMLRFRVSISRAVEHTAIHAFPVNGQSVAGEVYVMRNALDRTVQIVGPYAPALMPAAIQRESSRSSQNTRACLDAHTWDFYVLAIRKPVTLGQFLKDVILSDSESLNS